MFIGHFALGFAAKKIDSKPSLGTYFLAVQFLDLLWPTLLLLNLEKVEISSNSNKFPLTFTSYPISHSLALVMLWGVLFAFVYWVVKRNVRSAIVLGLCVVSHWFLDLIVHIPDLPLYPGDSPLLGLGLWKSATASLIVELILFASGVLMYSSVTKPAGRVSPIGFWALVIFLLVIQIANAFSAPPPNVAAIAWTGQLQWLFVLWAWWIDRHRCPTETSDIIASQGVAVS